MDAEDMHLPLNTEHGTPSRGALSRTATSQSPHARGMGQTQPAVAMPPETTACSSSGTSAQIARLLNRGALMLMLMLMLMSMPTAL
jgi:hypothetical protein